MNRLYGEWQTAAWAPPQATGGRVPKNDRGQVDVPPFALALPQGMPNAPCFHIKDVSGTPETLAWLNRRQQWQNGIQAAKLPAHMWLPC